MGSRREQGYIPSSAPPTSPGGAHLWWGKLSWASPHHPLQGQPLANGSRDTTSTWPVQGGVLH